MEEMLEDTLDMEDDEEIEEEADAEVDKVLFELTNGKLGEAGSVGTELPVCCVLFIFDPFLIVGTVVAKQIGGGRNRAKHGEVSPAAEWFAERVIFFR
jgi:hypothetical protein